MTNCKLCCLALSIVFLLACLMPALAIEVSAQATVTKVMPLGDSITDGYNIPGGYRIDLWSTFQQAGQFVDFVGSMSNGPASLGDKHHEGHSGWRIEQINGSVSGWLSGAQPEIVLLMIGTNDMLQDYNVAGAPARLSALLDTITQQSPNTQVIVASLPPLSNAIANQRVLNFNAAIPDIVAAKAAGGKKVSFIDMYPRLTVGDLADGIHPNASGYTKLANAWYSALTPFLSAPASTPTPSRTPTRTNTATPSSTPMPGSAGFYRAINLGGPAVTHDGQAWDASSAPNYTVIGTSQCNPWLTYTPPVDTTKAAILGCWVQHWAHNLAVNNMPNGTYDVYLYVQQDWDDPNAQPFTLSVEGQSAAGWNPGGAGSWVRLGPIRRTVSDGRRRNLDRWRQRPYADELTDTNPFADAYSYARTKRDEYSDANRLTNSHEHTRAKRDKHARGFHEHANSIEHHDTVTHCHPVEHCASITDAVAHTRPNHNGNEHILPGYQRERPGGYD
jgi:lysophospholipase L1-like esterase